MTATPEKIYKYRVYSIDPKNKQTVLFHSIDRGGTIRYFKRIVLDKGNLKKLTMQEMGVPGVSLDGPERIVMQGQLRGEAFAGFDWTETELGASLADSEGTPGLEVRGDPYKDMTKRREELLP